MILKTATVDDLLSWNPCYEEAHIRALAGGRTEFTALDVLQHPDINAQDKLWVILRPHLLDDRTLRLFACNCAERALCLFEREYPDDTRPRNAIEVARRFADGAATSAELDSARDSARDARAAARAAAWAAARDSAWAARAAAWAAAWDSAWDSARAAELDWQVRRMIEMITDPERLVDPGASYSTDGGE